MSAKKIIVYVLLIALIVGTVQPVSAASITGNVAPSGTDYLMNYLSNAAKLPDRTRYTFEIPQPEENYYSLSYTVAGSDSYTSYDFKTTYVGIGGWSTSNSNTYYLYAYPAGRVYYRLPFSASLISSTDSRTEITVQLKRITSYKDGTASTYSDSPLGKLYFCFHFYNDAFQLVSSVDYSSSGSTVSGGASADSFATRTYNSSVVIPSEAVYVVPVFYISRNVSKSSSQPSSWSYDRMSSVGMSCSIQFDVMNAESLVDGIWQFNDTISYVSDFYESVNFSSGGVRYNSMYYLPSILGGTSLSYELGADTEPELVYNNEWYIDSRKIVDFGASGSTVSREFYDFLTSNATRISDSTDDPVSGGIVLKDPSGSNVLESHDFIFPATVNVTETGLLITSRTDSSVTWEYSYTGVGSFLGVSTVPNAYITHYSPGSSFVMTSPGSVYLHLEGDIGNGGSGTTDPTDPTDPGGSSGPTEPTKDPLEDEKDQAGVGGNSAADDLAGAIPDYSEGFITALQDFVGAFSYEGTACYLTVPAITMPAIGGIIPEYELYPESVVNVEELFFLLPENLMLLAQSLLTGGLIIYCFKELYDTISYFLTLRKGEG